MKSLEEHTQTMSKDLADRISDLAESMTKRLGELPARMAEVNKLMGVFARNEAREPVVDEFGIDDYDLSEYEADRMVGDTWKRRIIANVETLRKLRILFGLFTLDEDSKCIWDGENGLVSIGVKFETEPLTFYVETVRKLPSNAKCKIVETTSTHRSLVCSQK